MGDLEIRSGGVVAVDTESLRAAAARLETQAGELDDIAGLLRIATERVDAIPRVETIAGASRAWALAGRASRLAASPRSVAAQLRDAAAVFELVELRAERDAADAAGDLQAVMRLDERIDALDREHPLGDFRANWQRLWRDLSWPAGLAGQIATAGGWFPAGAGVGLGLWGLLASARAAGNGTVEAGTRMTGPIEPVRVQAYPPSASASGAPPTLAAAAARFPWSDEGRIRVERYTMPDGSRQFAVYIRGTTSGGPAEPFDGTSNTQLYTNERSASYEATLAALRAAGAEPGDVVHAFGHSQGAMVASRLALEGGFDTQTLVTFGSPVEADVGEGTLSVAVRHTDDAVAALAAGGHDAGVGAPGSFVAERAVDESVSLFDTDPLQAHHLTAYEETAAMLDASADPRMDAVREHLAQLGAAASVEITEYAAERDAPALVSPSCGGAG